VDVVSGGSNSPIQIFEWVGSFDADGNGSPGGNFGPLQELAFGEANGGIVCAALGAVADAACATTNNAATGSYWPYVPKSGSSGTFPQESFFEGGIDLTAFAGNICINSFLANTRTSHSETADLKDLALGDFNTCGSIDLVNKVCDMPEGTVRPEYIPSTDKFRTFHEIVIRNDGGGGPIYDVGLREDSLGGTFETTCRIVNISGGSGNPSVPITMTSGTFHEVADSLAQGVANQMVVTVECDSKQNPLINSATVQAGQVPGGTSLTDSFTEDEEAVPLNCTFDASPSLTLTKECSKDVVLDEYFKPKVCVNVTLKNDSSPAQPVDIDMWVDDHADGSSTDILATAYSGGLQLDAGEEVSYEDCYFPTAPDNPDETDPGLVTYGDTSSVAGTGAASGSDEATSLSVTCPLCPN
jgi:hypothetical protein